MCQAAFEKLRQRGHHLEYVDYSFAYDGCDCELGQCSGNRWDQTFSRTSSIQQSDSSSVAVSVHGPYHDSQT